MHPTVWAFCAGVFTRSRVAGKSILEVGSYNVNGSCRDLICQFSPAEYIGVDLQPQPHYVDVVCNAERLLDIFHPEHFDIVVSTESLEHIKAWAEALYNMQALTKVGGILVLTTRSPGFPKHDYPADYWRFTPESLRQAFRMWQIEALLADPDPNSPGVLLAAIKTQPTTLTLDQITSWCAAPL